MCWCKVMGPYSELQGIELSAIQCLFSSQDILLASQAFMGVEDTGN